jgi:PPOX class probable F420-dependent enzyme
VLPVTFALHAGAVWTAIDEKPKRAAEPARVRYLLRRPEAALCVDHYDDDWTRLAWVQLLGRVAVLDAGDAPGALDALAARYAPYRERRPPGPLLRLALRASDASSGGRRLDDAEDLAHAADEQPLLFELDPDAGRAREDDVVARADRHPEVGELGRALADGEDDPLVRRKVVRALRDDEARAAHPVGLELLDHDLVEERAQDLGHAA